MAVGLSTFDPRRLPSRCPSAGSAGSAPTRVEGSQPAFLGSHGFQKTGCTGLRRNRSLFPEDSGERRKMGMQPNGSQSRVSGPMASVRWDSRLTAGMQELVASGHDPVQNHHGRLRTVPLKDWPKADCLSVRSVDHPLPGSGSTEEKGWK